MVYIIPQRGETLSDVRSEVAKLSGFPLDKEWEELLGDGGDEFRSVESRGDCKGRDPDGRFGEGNDCQGGGGSSSGKGSDTKTKAGDSPAKPSGSPRTVGTDVAQGVISSPPTTRSPDGKAIVSSPFAKEDTYKFAGREFVSTVAAGKYLSDKQTEARGEVINSGKPLSDADRAYVSDSHVQQVQQATSLGIKPVFYTPEERQRQIDEYARIEPKVLGGRAKAGFEVSPENADFLFRAVQALTSSNATPFANMQRTDAVLNKFFNDDGRISTATSFGVTGAAISKSLSRLQAVVDILGKRTDGSIDVAKGLDGARDLFVGRTMRVSDFQNFFRSSLGTEGGGKWKPNNFLVDQEVPVFCTFGPKFGCFFANNTGDPNHLTADIWATRTWGRVTGELLQEAKPDKAKKQAKELLKVVKSANQSQLHGVDGDQLVASLKKMAATGEIDDVVRGWSSSRLRHYASTDYSEKRGTGGKLNKLAKNVAENDLSLMGDPGSGKRRANMIKVYSDIQKKTGLPVAYAQDVLWQHEQDAYAALGAKTATEIGKLSFYSDEIKRIADDPTYRLGKIKKERRDESAEETGYYDDYERGGRDDLLYWEMTSHLSDEEFARLVVGLTTAPATLRPDPDTKTLADAPTSPDSLVESLRSIEPARVILRAAPECRSVWPRMGFDAKIPAELRATLPESLSHATTLLDLHATREGAAWWQENGTDIDVEIDLRDTSSPQMKVLDRCMNAEGRDLSEVWEEIWESDDLDDYCGDEQTFFAAESRDCGQDDLGRFASGNDCANDDGSGGGIAKDIPPSAKQASKTGGGSGGKTAKRDAWKKKDDTVVLSASQSKVLAPVKSALVAHGRLVSESLDYVGVTLDEAASVCADLADDSVVLVTHGDTRSLLGYVHHSEPLSDEVEPEVTFCSNRSFAGVENGLGTIVSIARNDEGELSLNYALLGIKPEAQKASPVAIAREMYRGVFESISNAEKIGVKEIVMKATGDAKDSKFKGYRIWPRLGFDGVIPRNKITPTYSLKWGFFDAYGSSLPDSALSPRAKKERAAGSLTIQALYETKEGQDWWEKHGGTMDMIMRVGDEDNPGWQRYKKISSRVSGRSVDFDAIIEAEWRSIREEVESRSADCGRDDGGMFASGNDCASGDDVGSGIAREPSPSAKQRTGGWGGGISADFGKTNESAVFTPERPLFKGAERIGRIDIATPKDVRELLQDSMKMTIADAILASGAVVDSQDRVAISKPRVSVNSDAKGVYVEWHATGMATGRGYSKDEKEFAEKPGTAVNAVNAARVIHATPSGVVVDADGLEIHPDFRGQGLAMEAVARMASAPVIRIKMDAVRADTAHPRFRYTGYSVWPKYGYDAPVSKVKDVLRLRHSLGLISSPDIPKEFASAKSLSDIYAIPGGKEWWTRDGDTIALTFDVRPRSRSMLTMLEYQDASRRKHEVRGMTPDKNNHGADVDDDVDVLDKIWEKYQKEGLPGNAPTQEEWDEWDRQDAEIKKKAKDGDSGKVQPH